MKVRLFSIIIVLSIMILSLTGCSNNEVAEYTETKGTAGDIKTEENVVEKTVENTTENAKTRVVDTIDYKAAAEKQLAMPEKGDTVAVIKVKDYGAIKVKFFEDVAPKAVENFLTHAKNGYYDGVIFHRVINDFMIQTGDPLGNGTGGESIWGEGFGEELDFELVPYRGALSMATTGKGRNGLGSQFYIVQGKYNHEYDNYMQENNFPNGLIEQYRIHGGYPTSLYLNYTIFGQVYEGMDIVDKIAAVETDVTNDKPYKDVVVEKIIVTEY